MAYPEPIPELRGPHAKEFLERLERLHLSASQRKLFAGARSLYLELKPEE